PPQDAQLGQGVAAQFGVGQQGARGQNQNNAWN
ncbi:AIM24 family protein, partial [Streptomyces chryseus]